MPSTPITDTWINEYIENYFSSYFSQTRKLHNDYWYIWAKSGLLDFACEKLRKKYDIQLLDYFVDYINGDIAVSDFDSVNIDTHQFYDSWSRKDEFRIELEKVVYELKLHRSAFSSLFEKIFYDIPIDVEEKWPGIDSNVIHGITSRVPEIFMVEGFTKDEIEKIKSEITDDLKRKLRRKKLTESEKQSIKNWCDHFKRKSRSPKNREVIYQAVEQLKIYKHTGAGRDDTRGFANVRQTSGISASELQRRLPDSAPTGKQYSDVWFRVLVKDLYDRFPLLRDFINDYQEKLPT
ncbi:hypothetical protein KBC89_00305 [Candidatus Woesebacteria bacterium]|nr:hypothetical protein [Candidatus Woesebacteria bacterium]